MIPGGSARGTGRWAIFWALGQFSVQAFAGLVAFFLIAREVGPAAYSEYVVGLAIAGLAQCFGLAIFREPVIQKQHIDELQLASAAKLSALWSFLVALVTSMATWMWCQFGTGSEVLLQIVLLLAFRIFLDGVVAVPMAGKARALDLKLQSLSAMLGSVVMIVVVIVSVREKIGIVGLALGQLAGQFVQSAISLYFSKFFWFFNVGIQRSVVRDLLPRSVSVVSWQIIDYINGSLDRLFVSARMHSTQIGVYGFGKRLNDIIFETVGGGLGMVCLPAFARANGDGDLLRQRFLGWVSCASFFVLPLLSYLFLCADELVHILFGEKWLGAVPIYRVFLILGIIQAFGVIQAALIRGMGQANVWTRYLMLQAVGNIIVVFLFSGVGALPLAQAIVVKTYVVWGYSVILVCRLLELKISRYVGLIARPIIAAVGAAGLVWWVCGYFSLTSGWWFILASALLFVLMYLLMSRLINKTGMASALAVVHGRSA